MRPKDGELISEEFATALMIVVAIAALILLLLVEWPMLATSTLRGDPAVMSVTDAVAGAVQWIGFSSHPDPRDLPIFTKHQEALPGPGLWIALDVVLLMVVGALGLAGWARVDAWRGRRDVAGSRWNPRSQVTTRTWARPRDLLHLQPAGEATGLVRRALTALVRLARLQRGPGPRRDSWGLGKLSGAQLRSMPESHMMAVAPTRAGKTTRVLIPALLERPGPAIVLSNKFDVLHATVEARLQEGPVWVYAPMSPPEAVGPYGCTWTPLDGCEDWDFALRMGLWLKDADPSSSKSDDSSGARFYNREAYGTVLPPLMHAAALSGGTMADVLRVLRTGVKALDAPRGILEAAGAVAAADRLAGLQKLDERPRSLVLMSAAQLVDAYRFPSIQASDAPGFRPEMLDACGTLYLIAPEAEQEMLAPLFGGIIGQTLRRWEQHAAHMEGCYGDPLRILADEAAHLAPLSNLPRLLAVSAGWNVRWLLIYQSLAQLQDRYGPGADIIIGNVLSKLFMGPIQDESTRRYLMDLLDEETVTSRSWSTNATGVSGGRTHHERQASKVSSQRLMQLPEGKAVMIHGRDLPAITKVTPYWKR